MVSADIVSATQWDVMDPTMIEAIEQEISEFDEWNARLHEDLSYLMDQPANEENLLKIGNMVDYYFSDVLFDHHDHEVQVIRMPDGVVAISVFMEYEDPDDHRVDFGVDFEIKLSVDDDLIMAFGEIDDGNEPFAFEVMFSYEPDPAIMQAAEEAYRRKIEESQKAEQMSQIIRCLKERRIVDDGFDRVEAHDEMERWHSAVMADRAAMAAMTTDASDTAEKAIPVTESPDDILFAPIVSDEKKKTPAPSSDTEFCYDD